MYLNCMQAAYWCNNDNLVLCCLLLVMGWNHHPSLSVYPSDLSPYGLSSSLADARTYPIIWCKSHGWFPCCTLAITNHDHQSLRNSCWVKNRTWFSIMCLCMQLLMSFNDPFFYPNTKCHTNRRYFTSRYHGASCLQPQSIIRTAWTALVTNIDPDTLRLAVRQQFSSVWMSSDSGKLSGTALDGRDVWSDFKTIRNL